MSSKEQAIALATAASNFQMLGLTGSSKEKIIDMEQNEPRVRLPQVLVPSYNKLMSKFKFIIKI